MQRARIAELPSRGVVHVSGADARGFLQNLLTCDMDDVDEAGAGYGALLTPQGKILFDFLVLPIDDGYLLDLPKPAVADLVKRLTFYRLRARVEIRDVGGELAVFAAWGGEARPEMPAAVARDPRLAALGFRAIGARSAIGADLATPGYEAADEADYHAHRIALGVPEGLADFAYGEAFPHDADLDELNAVAFDKGCFVGQEVVSRMKHRGNLRRRIVLVHGDRSLPEPGTEIVAEGKPAGAIGSSAGAAGLALVRLDRIREAMEKGADITAAGVSLRFTLPAWAGFGWPEPVGED